MPKRLCLFVAVYGLLFLSAPARVAAADPAGAPPVVIQIRSIDGLLADVKYVAALAGAGDQVDQVEGLLKTFSDGKSMAGIDPKRPLGMYATVGKEVADSSFMLMIPMVEPKTLLDLLGGFGVNPTKDKDDIYSMDVPMLPLPGSLLFRFIHDYAYITVGEKKALAKDKLLPPAKVFTAGQTAALSAQLRLDQIPDLAKDFFIGQVESQLPDMDQKRPDETAAQFKLRQQATKELTRQLVRVVKEGGDLALRLDVDHKANTLIGELSLSGKPKTSLAADLAGLGKGTSMAAGLRQPGAAVNLAIHMAVPENLRKVFVQMVEEGFLEGIRKETDADKKALATQLYKALEPTLQAGEMDMAVVLRGPTTGKRYTLVGGMKVQSGAALEKTLKDMVQGLPAADRAKVKIDAETIGGVKVHRLDVQKDFDKDARELFGDHPLYLAVRENGVFMALGEGGVAALTEALAVKPKAGPLLELDVAVAALAGAMGNNPADKAKAVETAQKVFTGADKANDKIRVTLDGGTSLKMRVEVKAAVVKFFSQYQPTTNGKDK